MIQGWPPGPPFFFTQDQKTVKSNCLVGRKNLNQIIQTTLQKIAEQAINQAGLSLYDLEYLPGKKFLRLYIINEATKTAVIDECVKVDHLITPLLEDLSALPQGITLEVSSPGLYRDLKNRKHFEWSIGTRIKLYLTTEAKINNLKGKKRTDVLGVLKEVVDDANGFALGILPEKEKQIVYVTSNLIRKALTDPKI